MAAPAPIPAPHDRARRMRWTATGLLVAMACLFALALAMQDAHPAWGYVLAFAEAAMVGGIADWFAVTALFRHPLRLPIPHTAIIPRNKDRIADSMAAFLRANFLVPQVVARRLKHTNIAAGIGDYLAGERGGGGRLRLGASDLLADLLESLDQERLGGIAKGAVRRQLERMELSAILGTMLANALADGRHRPVLDASIRWGAGVLADNEYLIRDMVHQRAGSLMRFMGIDERLANGIVDGLHKLLQEMAEDPGHPMRMRIEIGLESLAHDLVHDPAMRLRVARAQAEIVANPEVARWLDGLWERARAAMLRAARDPAGALSGQLGASIAELGGALRANPRLQAQVNRFARRTIAGIASRYGSEIVRLVSETVKRWDAGTITGRLEGAVGRDLQFIRINGTLVGGLVGLVIHAIAEAV